MDGENCLEMYRACRPDEMDNSRPVYLTEEMTWTRNPSLAHQDLLDPMLAIAKKIRHAYPDLFLEKAAAEQVEDSDQKA